MRILRRWAARLAGHLPGRHAEDDLREELEAHLEMEIEEYVRRGMDPDTARRTARIASGGLTQAAEAVHDQRSVPWLEHAVADLRFAFRALRRTPAFTATVIATLALGLGANTAIFSVVRGVLLKPLPHRDGDALLYLRQSRDGPGGESLGFSVPEVRDLRAAAPSLQAVAELSNWTVTLQRPDGAERMPAALVTGNWFEVMGLLPILGRVTGPGDDGPGVPVVVVLTYDGWVRRFAGDSSVIGRSVTVDGKPATVIGVLQPAPFYPGQADALLNMVASDHHLSATMVEGRTHRMTEIVARLAPQATVQSAQAEVSALQARMQRDHPEAYPEGARYRMAAVPFRVVMAERAELTLWLLAGAAAFVLVIAVANVANLTLMRGVRRQHELVVRASLGAGSARLRRLLLTENLLLAVGGAGFGAAVGGLSPPPPPAQRHARRPAHPARLRGWAVGRGPGLLARAPRVGLPAGRGRARPVRRGPATARLGAGGERPVPAVGSARAAHPGGAGRRADRDVGGRRAGSVVGRAGAGVPGPPRDVERELGVPPVGVAAVPGQGPQPQQPAVRGAGDGRGVAQQPPRLPELGPSRLPVVAGGRELLRHPPPRGGRAGVEGEDARRRPGGRMTLHRHGPRRGHHESGLREGVAGEAHRLQPVGFTQSLHLPEVRSSTRV